jgi:Na+-translocating ferredoxin:NAD+ oxidoreductase RnfG subunit
LGAIGKGYAIDKAVAILKDFGITCAKISCRSTIYGLGAPHGKAGWPVTIEGREASPILLYNQAISTSSNKEQFGHIINPVTGISIKESGVTSVLSHSAAASDAFSTAAFVRRGEKDFAPRSGWPVGAKNLSPPRPVTRRGFLAKAASFILCIGLTFLFPRLGKTAVVYQTEDQALKKMMPDADRFDTKEITLTADQQLQAEQITGKRLSDSHLRYNMATKGADIIGYAFPIEVIGKERLITLLIGVTKEGTIIAVEVLIYRESQGSEIRYPCFMAQFLGKKKKDPLRMGDDIQSISGATLSSRGVTYGVKKALALFHVIPK